MKKIIDIAVTVLTFLTIASSYAGAKDRASVRESLLSSGAITRLYSVDEDYTFIIGELPLMDNGAGDGFTVVNRYNSGEFSAYMIKHAPEPLLYKSPVIPAKSEIGFPEGVMNLQGEPLNVEKTGYSALDLFEHMNILCRINNGTPAFVITKRYGNFKRLTRVGAAEAFNYILLSENTGDAWLMTCEGGKKFIVEKNYRFLNGGADVADIRPGTGLDGVSYVENTAAAGDLFAASSPKEIDPNEETAFLEEMALEVAGMKMNFVKPHNGTRYSGAYAGNGGCSQVSIKRTEDLRDDGTMARVYDFNVCYDKVAFTGERVIKGLPGTAKGISISPRQQPARGRERH